MGRYRLVIDTDYRGRVAVRYEHDFHEAAARTGGRRGQFREVHDVHDAVVLRLYRLFHARRAGRVLDCAERLFGGTGISHGEILPQAHAGGGGRPRRRD